LEIDVFESFHVSITCDQFFLRLILAQTFILEPSVHIKDVKAIRESKDADEENEHEDPDVEEHFYNHPYERRSRIHHSHEIEELKP